MEENSTPQYNILLKQAIAAAIYAGKEILSVTRDVLKTGS